LEEVGRDWSWTVEPDGDTPASRCPIRIETRRADAARVVVTPALLGDHQRDNATAAVAALHALGRDHQDFLISTDAIHDGLAGVDWPGRLQVLHDAPLLVVDGAHNAASALALRDTIYSVFTFDRLLL